MRTVILAGGKGTRLQTVVSDVPKPMAPVNNKPFLEYIIRNLHLQGFTDICLSVGYKKDSIIEYFEDGSRFGCQISYSVEQSPLHTGGAIKHAISSLNDKNVMVINGDTFFDIHYQDLIQFHRDHQGSVSIGLAPVTDVHRYGAVETNDRGQVTSLREKGTKGEGVINGGIYVINRDVFNSYHDKVFSFEQTLLPSLIPDNLYGKVFNRYFVDIGIPEDYYEFQKRQST